MSLDRKDGVIGSGEIGYARIGSVGNKEEMGVNDTQDAQSFIAQFIEESLGVSTDTEQFKELFRTLNEELALDDVRTLFTAKKLTEAAALQAATSRESTFKRAVEEQIAANDQFSRAGTFKRTLTENAGLAAGLTTSKLLIKVLTEDIGLSDAAKGVIPPGLEQYNRKKNLEVKDYGGNMSEAVPVYITSSDNAVEDFEDDSSILNWEDNSSDITIDSNSEVNGTYSLKFEGSSGNNIEARERLPQAISTSGTFKFSFKVDSLNSGQLDKLFIELRTRGFEDVLNLEVDEGEGELLNSDTDNTIFSGIQSDTVYDVEISLQNDGTADITVNDDTTSDVPLITEQAEIGDVEFTNATDDGSTGNNYWLDDITIKPDVGESDTGNESIGIDWSDVSGKEDIAFFDDQDNLLPYQFEEFDTDKEVAIVWVYNDWDLNGSTQAKIAYGDNKTDLDRSFEGDNGGGGESPWANLQNGVQAVYHFDESSGELIDQTPNGNDSTSTTNTTYEYGLTEGEATAFGASRFFDGDGSIKVPDSSSLGYTDDGDDRIVVDTYVGTGEADNDNGVVLRKGDLTILTQTTSQGQSWKVETPAGDSDDFESDEEILKDEAATRITLIHDESSETLEVYRHGEEVSGSPFSVSGSVDSQNEDLFFGDSNLSSTSDYVGAVDETRIFNDKDGEIDSTYIQATEEASAYGGRVFFSQLAAEDTDPAIFLTLTEALAVDDVNTQSFFFDVILNESTGFGASLETAAERHRLFTEEVGVNDQEVTTVMERVRELVEGVSLTASTSTEGVFKRAVSESLGLAGDAISSVGLKVLEISEQIGLSSNAEREGVFKRTVEEAINLLSIASRGGEVKRIISESISAASNAKRSASMRRKAEEVMGLEDEISRQATLKRTLTEGIGLFQRIITKLLVTPNTAEEDDTDNTSFEGDGTSLEATESDDSSNTLYEEDSNRKP